MGFIQSELDHSDDLHTLYSIESSPFLVHSNEIPCLLKNLFSPLYMY